MTPRLTTNYAKNYCNRTLIVKVIAENVVTCFFWDTVYMRGAQVYATPLAAVVAHILAVHRQRTWRP